MSIKMSVVRSTVQGEQIVFDILQCNAVTGEKEYAGIADMHQAMEDALAFADMRVYEMRQRGIEGYALRQYCTPQEWQKVQDILDFMAGRQDLDLIQRRWQSQQEEQAALEEGRLAATQEQEAQDILVPVGDGVTSPQQTRLCLQCNLPQYLDEFFADTLDPLGQLCLACKYKKAVHLLAATQEQEVQEVVGKGAMSPHGAV